MDFLNNGGPPPPVLANADSNGDGVLDNRDLQAIDLYLSGSGSLVDCTCLAPLSCANQKPGDFNSDGVFSIADIIFITPYLHRGGTAPSPIANSDANGDCIFNVGDTKHVLDFLFSGGPSPVDCTCFEPEYLTVCCWQSRGNVDYDPADIIDISDLVYIVDIMFNFGSTPICHEEANIDGDVDEIIDISDLVYLVDYMFSSGPLPAFCP